MTNNNKKEALNATDSMEVADKALETVSGGSTEMKNDLTKYHKHLESLREQGLFTNTGNELQMSLEKPTTQNDRQKTEGTVTDLTGSCIVYSGKAPSQEEINSFLDTLL